jgi:hypothetical protein
LLLGWRLVDESAKLSYGGRCDDRNLRRCLPW